MTGRLNSNSALIDARRQNTWKLATAEIVPAEAMRRDRRVLCVDNALAIIQRTTS